VEASLANPDEAQGAAATADETLADLLGRSRRSAVPIRRVFLQLPDRRPGPLSRFVEGRRALALDLWLLVHAGASSAPWDVRQPAMSWARMLDMPQTTGSETTISRNWTWLEKELLVHTERDHRQRKVTLLKEDGSGENFDRATGKDRGFFKLPYAYFTDRLHGDLKLPGKATLLICLAQNPTFTLPTEAASKWYGVSADTLQRGLDELRERELIRVWSRQKKAPRARYGVTTVNHYALQGPFARAPVDVAAQMADEAVVELLAPTAGRTGVTTK
jgi:hypothetical protein